MRTRLWVSAIALGLVISACGGDDDEGGPERPQSRRATARRDSVERKPVYPEAEAAQIMRVMNAAEIATARVARERTQNDDIMRFANVMMADHGAMTALLDSLSPPVPDTINPEGKRLRDANTQLVDSLWRIEGGFNNTYIENQVRAHEQALLLMDTALIPSARNPQLKKLMRDLRPAVVAHLQRAKQIYAARMANPALATQPRPTTAPRPSAEPAAPRPQPQTPPLLGAPTDTTPPSSTTNM